MRTLLTTAALALAVGVSAQAPLLWSTEYETLDLLSRPENFAEDGADYLLRVRAGNERREVRIDKQSGALESSVGLGRGCGTLVYGPIPLGPRSLVQFQSDAKAGKLTVRPLDLNAACAVESVRWTRTIDLPVGTSYGFCCGAVDADTTELRASGVIDLGRVDDVAYSQPVILSLDAKTGAVRYVFVGERVASRFGPGELAVTSLLSDGGTAAVLLNATGRADRLYRVDGAGKLRFSTTAGDSTLRLRQNFELADGSLAVWTERGSGGTPGLEVYAADGTRRGSLDFDAAIDAALGADYRLVDARSSVLRRSGRLATAFEARQVATGKLGVVFAETDAGARLTGAQYVDQTLANAVLTVRNRLYEDSEGALVLFGEGTKGLVGIRTRGNLISGVRSGAEATTWRVYPQPVRDLLTVEFPDESSAGEDAFDATVRDVTGRVVLERVLPTGAPLNVADLSAGVYSLTLRGHGSRMIVVE